MFIVNHGRHLIEEKLERFFSMDPSVGLILAAVFFEWTACRALVCLSSSPNKDLRARLEKCHGLQAYKDIWANEVEMFHLPAVLKDWHSLTEAFKARNVLVHGRNRYTRNMATPHFNAILTAANDLWDFCSDNGFDLSERLPVRRHKK